MGLNLLGALDLPVTLEAGCPLLLLLLLLLLLPCPCGGGGGLDGGGGGCGGGSEGGGGGGLTPLCVPWAWGSASLVPLAAF
jgi:hypothetical protein